MSMNSNNKRSSESDSSNKANKKRLNNGKKQTSLLDTYKFIETKNSNQSTIEQRGENLGPKEYFQNVDDETLELLSLEKNTMNKDWLTVLSPEMTKSYFIKLKLFLKAELAAKKTIFPPLHDVYRWSNSTPFPDVKVVIIGQDPYHNYNQAHGLCFSVAKNVKTPPSLINIYKGLKVDYPDFIIPNHGYLENWAKQGVLLLNTCLTVEAHKPGSHSNQGWELFTDAIIRILNEKKKGIVFILWGSHAQKKGAKIDKDRHLILKGVHPSPLSAHRGFFENNHFKKANEYLNDNRKEVINWNCL